MKTKRISDYRNEVKEHHLNGQTRGCDTGFKCLDELLSFRKGYTTYFLGFPGHGKTEIHLEILMNLSTKYKWRHAIMSPEIGGVSDVIGELVSKYLHKPFFKSAGHYAAKEVEVDNAMNSLDDYFFVIDSDSNDFTIDSFYEHCKQIETDHHIKLDTTSIDPWNDLSEDLSKFGGREDKYLAHALKKVRQSAKVNDWHNMIITHARDTEPIMLSDVEGNKVSNDPVPGLGSFAGGMVWGRRAFNVVGVWRPSEPGLINPKTKNQFADDEAIIKIIKAKPKNSATRGSCSLYFDKHKNRYYEKNLFKPGERFYAFELEKVKIDAVESPKIDLITLEPNTIVPF